MNAAGALGLFGHRAEEATAPMFEALTRALIDCKTSVEEALALSLNRVTPDMHARLNDYFAELDPELLPLAREAFGLPASPDLDPDRTRIRSGTRRSIDDQCHNAKLKIYMS